MDFVWAQSWRRAFSERFEPRRSWERPEVKRETRWGGREAFEHWDMEGEGATGGEVEGVVVVVVVVVVVAVAVVVVVPGGGGGGSTVPVMLVNVLYARDYEGKVGG